MVLFDYIKLANQYYYIDLQIFNLQAQIIKLALLQKENQSALKFNKMTKSTPLIFKQFLTKFKINHLTLFIMTYLVGLINVSTPPIFITTLSNFQTSTWVLTTTNPVTTSGYSNQNTNVTYLNLYTSVPNIGYGLGFLNSNYLTTLALDEYVFDIQIVQQLQASSLIQLNWTAGTIQQISLNYIVCDSSFWLDVRQTLVNLSSQTVFLSYTSTRSVVMTLPYKSKSNSSNAQVVYNTIGMDMIRTSSHTYQFQMMTSGKDFSSFNITLQIQTNNKIKWIRLCTYSYQAVATTINPPYFIDWGFLSSFSGSIPDSSGLTLTSTGTIYTGMVNWNIDDSNTILNYNLALILKSYTLTTTSLSQATFVYVWYRMESCPDYTFLNGTVCDACDYTCLTCANGLNTSCLTCPLTRQYVSTNHSCICVTNYVDVGTTTCAQLTCSATCLTCSYINQCGSCLSSLQRYLNGTQCVCNPYKIDVFNQTGDTYCYPCYYNCYTCSVSLVQTACLSCSSTKDHRYYVAANNTCVCMDKYYNNASSSSPVCGSCQYSCQTCTTNTACVTCNSTKGRTYNSSTGFCSCGSGNYDDLLNQQCIACSITCLTCNSLGCLTCNTTTRVLNGTACKCINGYYDDGINAACQSCYYPCATCNDSTNVCTSCNNLLQRYFSNNTCVCADNYYSQFGLELCLSCDVSCLTCVNASSSGCLTCDSTKFRVYASLTSQCVCQDGYFQTSPLVALCSICGYTCSTCTNATQCLACNALKFRVMNTSNLCTCMNKYYDNGNQLCLACNYICLTCLSNLICDTCDTNTRNTTNLTTCPCLTGFYDNGISSSCLTCQAQCLTCTNGNNCSSCPSNKVLTTTKDCVCANGTYYPSCLPCQYSCQQCASTANNCTQCNGTAMRYLNLSTSQCLCYQGYFSDGVTQQCQTCYYSCLTCSSYSSCDTCPTNRIANGSFCSCISQYYQNPSNKNCLPCHYSCQQCSAYTQCTSCNAADFRYAKIPLSLCTCMNGYYDNFISELCYACDSRCQTCSAFSTCLSCNSTLNRYFVNSTFECLCLSGYYQDSTTFLCVKCQYSCQTCLNENQCVTCPVGRTLSLTTGFCTCNNGTFDNPSTQLCSICSYPCQQCSGTSTTCTFCDQTRILITANNTCQCLTHTFDNGTACQSCLATCAQCTNSYSCISCLLGSNRNLDGNYLCPCIYGYQDSNGSLLICLKCHYSCLTCSTSSSCDTCYPGRIFQPSGLCYCPINNYYDDGVNEPCIPCSYSCLKCSKTPNNCTSCLASANRYLFGANCVCNQGYYDNNVVNCIKCEYSCMSCSTSSACTGCNSSYERVFVNGPYCDCLIGYFDNSISQSCDPCDYKCASCQTTSTNCLTCPTTRTINLTGNTCPCNTHLYDSGSPTCQSCLYYCAQCLNNAQCTYCPSTRYLQSTTQQCLCLDKYYNVINQLQCSSCYPLCSTCSDYQVCTNCDTTTNLRILYNSQCVCQNGYYDTYLSLNNAICQKCQYSCQNCVSAIQCSSCSSLAFRIYNVTTLLCSCSNGYYDDTINTQCLKCSFDCLTCSSATVCLTCPSQRTLINNRCDCSTSFYTNGTICQVCPPQCSACTNSSYCTACNGVRILVNNTCICDIGFFIIPDSALCSVCQYSCQSCVSYSACSTCNSSMQRYLSGAYCRCKTLYYDDNITQQCQTCQYSCRTCINGSKCLSCDSTLNRVYNLASLLCDCANGYYEDSTTKLCIKCHYTCVTCNNGSACQSCNNLYLRTLNTTSYQCQCPYIGYYDDFVNSLCQTCDYRCLSCQITSTTCTSCLNTTYRNLVVNSCTCIAGYYQILSLICPKCSYKCITCQGAADNCTSCSTANLRSVTPNCSCAVGFFDNGINSMCQSCDYRCETCINGLTCETCNSTNNRIINNLTSMCDCMPVFYDDGSNPICVTCHYTCVTCNHPTICLTCPITRTYNNGSCQCITQHYDDGSSLQCISCQYSCQSCTNSTQCSACANIKFRLFNTTTRYCSCKIRYYDNGLSQQLCLACQKTCLTCTNSSGCTTCPSNVNKTLNLTASPYCSCLYSYYQNYTAGALINQSSVCYKCYYTCQTCVNLSTTCTVCNAQDHRYLTSAYQCLCSPYYYDDGVHKICGSCYNNCLTCYGTGFSQCLTCDNNSYFLNSSCYPTCPSYYRDTVSLSSGLKVCQLCTAYCVSCPSLKTVCTLCQPTHRLFTFNSSSILCLDVAPQFYYDNGTDFLPCISPCLHCTAKYKCVDCVTKYYLDIIVTLYCYKCNDFCQSCKGPTAFDCISCIDTYFLSNGLCTKLSCSAYQYVNSLTGCTNCSISYPHSLTCTSLNILTCQTNYILSSSQTLCQNCSSVTGFKLSGSGSCVQICGDGIAIHDLCDDGNAINGDGCSSTCKIQKGWACANSSSCTLSQTPILTVIQVVKVLSQNKIQITLDISIGVRLVNQNFVLTFIPAIGYTHNVYATNSQYTQYVLEIYYKSTAQSSNLSIQIISPIPQQTQISNYPFNQRMLQTIVAPLTISLNMQIDLLINTQPPAQFIPNQVRELYSQVLFAILLSLHLIILLEIIVVVYKGIRVMLLSIDLYQHITILYLLCTFASYNVLELIVTSGNSLQPFIYSFGPLISDIMSNYFYFNYTQFVLSACIIQIIILISYVLYQTLSKNQKNSAHYYYTSFLYVFYIDIMIACLGTFLYVQFQGYLTIYSWAIALILFLICNTYTLVFIKQGNLYLSSIKSNTKQSKGKIVVPSASYITSELQLKQKESNFMENVLGFDLQSSHDGKSRLSQTQKLSHQTDGNKTQVLLKYSSQSKSGHSQNQYSISQEKKYNIPEINKQSYFYKNIINLYDLLPSSSNIQSSELTNKIGKYHILLQKHAFPLLIVIFISIQDAIIRSSLLFSLFIVVLLIFFFLKVQSIKTLRSIKLLINYLTYFSISLLLLIASTLKLNSYIIFDTIIAIIIPLSLAFNIVVFIVNIRYSNSYKEYLIQLRNNQILLRNQEIKGLQSKKKIYTNVYGNSGYGNSSNSGLNYNNGSPIKNIVRNYHNKNQNVYENDENYQVSGNSQSEQQYSDDQKNYKQQPQSLASLSLQKKSQDINQKKNSKIYTHTISSDVSQNQFLKPAQKFINMKKPSENKNLVTLANKKESLNKYSHENQIDETRQQIKSKSKAIQKKLIKNSNPNPQHNNQMKIVDYYDISPSAEQQEQQHYQNTKFNTMQERKPKKRTEQEIYLYDKEIISKQRINPKKTKSRIQRQKQRNSKEKFIKNNGQQLSNQRVGQIDYFQQQEHTDTTIVQSSISKNNKDQSKISSNILLEQKQLQTGPYYKYRNPNSSKEKKQLKSQEIRIRHNNTKYTNDKQSSMESPGLNSISRFTKNQQRNPQNQSKFSKFNNDPNQFNKKHLIDIEDIYDMEEIGDDNQTEIPLGLDNIQASRARLSDELNQKKKVKKQSKPQSRLKKQLKSKSKDKSNPKNKSKSKSRQQKQKKILNKNRQKVDEISDISSIKQQRELFMQKGLYGIQEVDQKDKMTVFNKILKDYEKYKNKKVDPKMQKLYQQNLEKLNRKYYPQEQSSQNSQQDSQQSSQHEQQQK